MPHRSPPHAMGRKRHEMFRDSLLEECTDRGTRRRWTTLSSFAIQIAAACLCVILPLLYPEALPLMHASSALLMPPPSGGPPSPPDHMVAHTATAPVVRQDDPQKIHAPGRIPNHIDTTADVSSQIAAACTTCIVGAPPGIGASSVSPVMRDILGATPHAVVRPPVSSIRVSPGVQQGLLISRVEPKYSEIARTTRTQGDVILAATIGRDGRIENLHVISGHPLLVSLALDAVKQWRYRPYMLGTEPVEVETQITVRFRLNSE